MRHLFKRVLLLLLVLLPAMLCAQTLTRYEYWFDDNVGSRGWGTLSGSTDVINMDWDANALDVGMHRLNFRVRRSDGMYSSISTATFYKLPNGDVKFLEYWLDSDRSNVTRLPLHEASTGKSMLFNDDIDLRNVSEGMHRLYVRAVNSDATAGTAVTMTPVMVKNRYEQEKITDAEVVKYSMTVDDEKPIVANVSRPAPEVVINNTLDLRDLPEGEHKLTLQVWNSAYASTTETSTFSVTKQDLPTVTLTAQQDKGLVTLRFNSLPNDVKWKIIRTDASGATATVRSSNQGCYPEPVTVVDNPVNGQYAYQARCYYTDADGNQQYATSNKVNLTMTNADQVRYGTISGLLKVQSGPTLNHDWVVRYSDNDNIVDHADALGTFVRDRVPVGTVVTISAEDVAEEGYEFTSKTITIKEGRNDVVLIGNFDVEKVKNSYKHDLEFASRVEFTPGQFMKFKVRKVCRDIQWHGKIRIASVKKAYLERAMDESGIGSGGNAEVGAGSTLQLPSFTTYNDYDDDYSEQITVESTPKEVYIKHNLSSMRGDKDELYYFFVYSVDNHGNEKLIGTNYDYNIKENPIEQLVSKNDWAASQQQVMEEDIEYAVNIILAMMKKTKEIDDHVGDVEKGLSFIKSTIEDQVIYDALNSNSWAEFTARYPKNSVTNIAYEVDVDYLNMIHSVRDEVATLVRASKDVLKVVKEAKKALDAIKLANDVWNNKNTLELACMAAEKILDLSESSFPFAKVLKTYLDITRVTVQNMSHLFAGYDAPQEFGYFKRDLYKFVIHVKKKGGGDFGASTIMSQIDYVEMECDPNINGDVTYQARYNAGKEWNSPFSKRCVLKRVNQGYKNPEQQESMIGNEYSIKDMRMTIYWMNGRKSYIPIRMNGEMRGNGVTYNARDLTFTITFQSGATDEKHIADIIKIDDPDY